MSTVAIITARGGSKRIPRKNIKPFMDKPMLAYPIEAALESGVFDEVMVSTDCPEIAAVALKCGAKVPFMRSEKTSDDYAPTFDVLEEVLVEYKKQGKKFDETCCIYPCSPFLTAETLRKAYQQLKEAGTDSLVPVCKYPIPIEWAIKIEDGILHPFDPAAQNMRSQDLIPKYYDAGVFYLMNTSVLLESRRIITGNTLAFILPESEVQDIDTDEDWRIAEMKYKILRHV
jgi:N-acylneuraminate cytidylyltransferase